ncbi:MAG: hypothetical protein H6836_00260 [Planctomycetes bacterium]|nr:hypothetical protein [Planctomycetota bacterium]MCB9887973.1 hypothetical protein [Planctomycetota bacterium]
MKIPVLIGLCAALAPAVHAGGDEPPGKVVTTTLSQVRSTPEAFKNIWVRFPVQFTSMGKVSNPFFTQFVPDRFANFYCWADEQQIWKKDQYESPFGLLFISKDHRQAPRIYGTKVYERMMVTGVVRNTFQGEPWIEVMEYYTVKKRVSTATLAHMHRADTLMTKRQWNRAISELSLAPGEELPKHVLGQIHRSLAVCYLRLGESGTALEHLQTALTMLPTTDRDTQEMARLARSRPESFLDRTVAAGHIEDHELPMWEAFGNDQDSPARPAAPTRK